MEIQDNKMKILIFGKNGQIGSNLCNIFNEIKFSVKSFSSKDIDFCDLLNLEKFLNNLNFKPNFIINAAAYTNVDKAEIEKDKCNLINNEAVSIIAKYCKKNNIILIHYSTDYVFDGTGFEPFLEDNTQNLKPLNYYGFSKLCGEKNIKNSGCEYLILRVSWVYDLNEKHKNFYNTIKKLAKEKEYLEIVDDQIGSPSNAKDIAEITKTIIQKIIEGKRFSGIYHITNQKYISWYDFALQIIQELKDNNEKLKVKNIKAIKSINYKTIAKRPLNSRLANTKLNFINY